MSGRDNLVKLVESYFKPGDFIPSYISGTIQLDAQNRIRAIDSGTTTAFAYEAGDLVGAPVSRLLPDFPELSKQKVAPTPFRQTGRTREGRPLELEVTPRRFRNDEGEGWLLLLHAWPFPSERLNFYGHIFHQHANGILFIELESRRLIHGNPRLREILRLPNSVDISTFHLADFAPPAQPGERDSADFLDKAFYELRRQQRHQFEVQLKTTNGQLVFAEVTAMLLPVIDERLAMLILRDITRRKHSQKELYESQETLEAVIKTAVDGIIIIDERGRMELVNQAVLELFGYNRSELIGENVRKLMPEPHHTRHDQYLENYHRTGDAQIIGIGREVRGRRKDGSSFPFRLAVSEVNLGDRKLFTGVIHDLTEQKAAEEKILRLNRELENKVEERTEKLTEVVNKLLQSNLKLEHEVKERKSMEEILLKKEAELRRSLEKEKELSELKSRFVSMASHEFRTPLTTIASSTELIGLYETAQQQEKRAKHLRRIQAAVTNLTGILGDFLSLSRLEEGKIEVYPEKFLLRDLCEEVVEQLQGMLKKGQHIETELKDCDSELYLDKKMLKNIFINLLSNAVKYSGENTTVYLRTRIEDRELIIDIVDRGIGIPEEDQKHLFSRFFRAHNAGNVQGTGLGLNIVKRYLDLMGGAISFHSVETEGTTFTVHIPIQVSGQG